MSMNKDLSYGFIGLGVMGWGMANNLIQKIPPASSFTICEVVVERRDKFVAEAKRDIEVAASPLEVAQNCDIIITMLPKGEHVRQVFEDPNTGLLASPGAGPEEGNKLFIDCSTIDVKTSQEVARAVKASKLGLFFDAPVSGSAGGAVAGTLTFMVGAAPHTYDLVQPVVAHMARNVFHCGTQGAGLATKQINNYMSAVNMIGVCEGMNMGRLYGLDPKILAAVVNVSTGQSHNSREQNPVEGVSDMASSANDFKPGFTTELCRGVLDMAMELQEQLGAKSMLAPVVRRLYHHACEADKCRNMDFRSIYRLFAEDDGRDLPLF